MFSRPLRSRWKRIKNDNSLLSCALSCEEFHRVLAKERAGADRHEHRFSLLLLEENAVSNPVTAKALLQALILRVRETDEVGWFDEKRIGILLPYTACAGASRLADAVCHMTPRPAPVCSVYTYPDNWITCQDTPGRLPTHASK